MPPAARAAVSGYRLKSAFTANAINVVNTSMCFDRLNLYSYNIYALAFPASTSLAFFIYYLQPKLILGRFSSQDDDTRQMYAKKYI